MVKHSYDVIWIRRTLVLCLVTWIAVRVGKLIVVVCMTVLAAGSTVLPGQCELCGIMVKCRGLPGSR